MRAAAITAQGTVELLDQPQPEAHGDLVVVQILVAPMSTEFKQNLQDAGECGKVLLLPHGPFDDSVAA
jgi:hypothetical protein